MMLPHLVLGLAVGFSSIVSGQYVYQNSSSSSTSCSDSLVNPSSSSSSSSTTSLYTSYYSSSSNSASSANSPASVNNPSSSNNLSASVNPSASGNPSLASTPISSSPAGTSSGGNPSSVSIPSSSTGGASGSNRPSSIVSSSAGGSSGSNPNSISIPTSSTGGASGGNRPTSVPSLSDGTSSGNNPSSASNPSSSTNPSPSTSAPPGTYTNPILDTGADPWVIREGDFYYMLLSINDSIALLRSPILTDWRDADENVLWTPPPGMPYSTDIWAPEIHLINGLWYVIFTADPNYDTPPPEVDMYCTYRCPAIFHRMFVLESSGSDIWTSTYSFKSELNTYDQFAIDGTYFQHSTGLYHIYSCWYRQYDGWPANLCITKMENPWTVSSNFTERQILSVPNNPWERTPYGRPFNDYLASNEAPQQLINPTTGQNFVIYSAGRSDNRNYCLGQLELVGDDPMNNQDWRKNNEGCVFYQNALEKAYGVGHASFVKSPDGTEDWIVYHGMENPYTGWSARNIRTQRFTWNADGTPHFPRPGYGPYPLPSGQE